MKHTFPAPLPDNPRNIMRRLSYGETPGFKGQISYQRRLHGTPFPRFHAYLDERDGGFTVNLHLDQKAPTYQGQSAHGGEYEGTAVEREMARIVETVGAMSTPVQKPATAIPAKKKGFFGSFFS